MKTWKKYLITLLAGFVMAGVLAWLRGVAAQTTAAAVYHILCDMFFVVGFVLVAFGLLIVSSNEGTFDMLVYGTKSFLDMFRKEKKLKYETFYDYRTARAEKKAPFGYLVICGLILLAVAVVMWYLHKTCGGVCAPCTPPMVSGS